MKCKTPPGECLIPDGLMQQYFPYARLSENGEYVIPKDKVDDFVKKYNEIADSREHQQILAAYRAQAPQDRQGDDGD
ncbi:hypothetical protein JCM15519_23800 [Fundidesulfovibrio butyratiphilus]